MGAIDDVRKVMQDVIAPDLKALDARILALDARVTTLDKKIDLRADVLDNKIDLLAAVFDEKLSLTRELILAEFKALRASMAADMEKLTHTLDYGSPLVDRRLEKLENERITAVRSPLEKRRLGLHRP